MEVAIEAGRETWEIFGELAAHRAASLNEVTKRCFCVAQRDGRCAARERHGAGCLSRRRLAQALNMLQLSLEFSLLRMCECFEAERQRTDEELATRRGARVPGHARRADRPAQSDADPGPRRADARALAPAAKRRSRRCSSTSTTSRASTTRSVTPSATSSCKRVAARLDGVMRDADALGRLGGDEFVVISEALSLRWAPS